MSLAGNSRPVDLSHNNNYIAIIIIILLLLIYITLLLLLLSLTWTLYMLSAMASRLMSLAGNSRSVDLHVKQHSEVVLQSSPSKYDQPPTPEHPPPSPSTAVFGIQQKINPTTKVRPAIVRRLSGNPSGFSRVPKSPEFRVFVVQGPKKSCNCTVGGGGGGCCRKSRELLSAPSRKTKFSTGIGNFFTRYYFHR